MLLYTPLLAVLAGIASAATFNVNACGDSDCSTLGPYNMNQVTDDQEYVMHRLRLVGCLINIIACVRMSTRTLRSIGS